MPVHDPFYSTSAWRQLRPRILDRDGHECQIRVKGICVGYATEVDHIVPRSVDPSLALVPDNLRAACRACNGDRGGKLGASRTPRASSRHRRVASDGYGDW